VAASILLVAQLSPPSTLVAARRVAGLTKYLSRLGYRVTVLTSIASGEGTIEGAAAVVRTRDLIATKLNWRREHFSALGGRTGMSYSRPSRIESLVVPDVGLLSWAPFAFRRALQLAAAGDFDCVITSSPPQSTHLIGSALRRRGLPWIAELRDGWTFDAPRRSWPLRSQRWLDERLERRVLSTADAVVAVTTPLAEDIRDRFALPTYVITNGFDPEEWSSTDADGSLLDPARHSLVYTGRMAVAGRDPTVLIEALGLLTEESPDVAARLELVFAGPLTAEEETIFRNSAFGDQVRTVGALDRRRVLELQHAADSLLVLAAGTSSRSVATGKLFEYLAAGKPILVLGDGTEAARIVAEAGAGLAVPAHEHVAVAGALRRLVEGNAAMKPDAGAIERYSYPRIASSYAAVIEEVSARRPA
jgi:glycosyltransferase involved in cell wall biosynthesis